jgi:hypothetical protein
LLDVSQRLQNDSEDLSAELSQFSSGADINKFLARLLILIHSHRAIARDTVEKPQQEESIEWDFSHWPGPPDADGLKGPAV